MKELFASIFDPGETDHFSFCEQLRHKNLFGRLLNLLLTWEVRAQTNKNLNRIYSKIYLLLSYVRTKELKEAT